MAAAAAAVVADDTAGMKLAMDTRMTHTPDVKPRLEPTPAALDPDVPTLAQAQPTLSNVLTSLQSGDGEAAIRWVDSGSRRGGANAAFVDRFNSMVAGRRVQQLDNVRFRSRQDNKLLVVEGEMQMKLNDGSNQVNVQPLKMRLQFQRRNGEVVLTELRAL